MNPIMISVQLQEGGKISVQTGGLDMESVVDVEQAISMLETAAKNLIHIVLFRLRMKLEMHDVLESVTNPVSGSEPE